jgi:hypothetical protein
VIGVVTTSYPRFPDDSAGVFVRERVRELLAQGHDVEVLAAGDGDTSSEGAVTRVRAAGLFYAGGAPEALEGPRLLPRLAAWGQALGFSCALLGELTRRAQRCEAVESHWLGSAPGSVLDLHRLDYWAAEKQFHRRWHEWLHMEISGHLRDPHRGQPGDHLHLRVGHMELLQPEPLDVPLATVHL